MGLHTQINDNFEFHAYLSLTIISLMEFFNSFIKMSPSEHELSIIFSCFGFINHLDFFSPVVLTAHKPI